MDGEVSDDILRIDYNEIPVTDMAAAKAFYAQAFGWRFVDYGPTYAAFENAGLDGGQGLVGGLGLVGALKAPSPFHLIFTASAACAWK